MDSDGPSSRHMCHISYSGVSVDICVAHKTCRSVGTVSPWGHSTKKKTKITHIDDGLNVKKFHL